LVDLENSLCILQPFREKLSGDESYVIQPTKERNISPKESTSSNPYNTYQTGHGKPTLSWCDTIWWWWCAATCI